MAIGDVSASGGISTAPIRDNSAAIRQNAASGLGDAINQLARTTMGYLGSQEELHQAYDKRVLNTKSVQAETAFVALQTERANSFSNFSRDWSADPTGLTEAYSQSLTEQEETFLKGLEPRLQDEYKAKLAQDKSVRAASMFRAQLDLMDAQEQTNLTSGLNQIGTALKAGQTTLEDASDQWAELAGKSGLPPAIIESMKLQGTQTLQQLQFGTDIEYTSKGFGTTGTPSDGSDVVAAGLAPQMRGVLNAIGAGEAGSYNVINGGETFTDFSDHPRRKGAGGTSTAAGRYQFIASTWDAAKASYEKRFGVAVPNFSPEWQDRVAANWVEVSYNRYRGDLPSFAEIMASNDPAQFVHLRTVLGNPRNGDPNAVEWQGIGDMHYAGGASAANQRWLSIVAGEKGIAGGGTGPATGPNPWTDPRYADISLEDKSRLASASATAAARALEAAAESARAQAASTKKSAFELGYQTGDLNLLPQVKGMAGYNAEVEKEFRQGVNDYWNKQSSVNEVAGKLSNGQALSSQDEEGFANWFGEQNIQGLANGDEEAYARLGYAATQANALPKGSAQAIEAAAATPATRTQALEFMAMLAAGDTSILNRSGFSAQSIADAEIFKRMAGRSGKAEAEAQYAAMDENRKLKAVTAGDANKATTEFFKDYDQGDIEDLFDNFLPFNQVQGPRSSIVAGKLQADAYSAYSDGYSIYGTPDMAKTYMETYLKNTWGPSSTGSEKELMRFPPENYYPPANESHSYLEDAAKATFAESAIAIGADLNQGFSLVSDATTEKEVMAGKKPTYQIVSQDANGGVILLPDRFGGDEMQQKADEISAARADLNSMKANIAPAREAFRNAMSDRAFAQETHGLDSPEWKEANARVKEAEAEANRRKDSYAEAERLAGNQGPDFDVEDALGDLRKRPEAIDLIEQTVAEIFQGPEAAADLRRKARSATLRARRRGDSSPESAVSDGVVNAVAAKLFVNPDVIRPYIAEYLKGIK